MVTTPKLTNPFPGLRPFELEQEHLFFGREGQADELLARLSQTRFLTVVGTSGSGKSSLVRAGLLPGLYSGFLGSAGSSWRVAILRPGNAPICHLAEALNDKEVFGVAGKDADIQARFTEVTLRRGALGLVEFVRQARMEAHESLLVLVDQFEEVFRFQESTQGEARQAAQDEASAFVKLLLNGVDDKSVPIYVVLTMRSDFLGDCAQFRGLPEAINQGQYLIPRMTREERRTAIEGPVAVGLRSISPELVNRLLNDMGDNPDQLPILQHALMRTWEQWKLDHHEDEPLDLRHYEAIGGMADALSIHADELYDGLASDRAQLIAERLFKALTDKGLDNREVRRPTKMAEIAAICGSEVDDVIAVVEAFRQEGASFLMPPVGELLMADTILDISHESLMRVWKRLKGWTQEEQHSAQLYQRLADAAFRYQNKQAALYRDPELTEALSWHKRMNPNEHWALRYAANYAESVEFLKQSSDVRQWEVTRRRIFTASLVGLSVIAVIGGTFAFFQSRSATAAKNEALNKEIEARSLTAQSAANAGKYVDAVVEGLRLAALHHQLDSETIDAVIQRQSLATLRHNIYKTRDDRPYFREQNRLEGHSAYIESVSFSPDGKTLASASGDGTVKLWSIEGKLLRTLEGHLVDVKSVSFSPDGQTLASASADGTVKLWNTQGELLQTLKEHSAYVTSVSFSPDGKTLASASGDGTVKLWSIEGELLQTLEEQMVDVRSVSFSPDGKTLASASRDGIKLWSTEGELLHSLEGHSSYVTSVSFSFDGKTLASTSTDGTVKLWSTEGELLQTLEGHSGYVNSVSFSPDGKTLASASRDSTVKLWSTEGKVLQTLEGHSGYVNSVSFSPDGKTLASASTDRMVKLWSTEGEVLQTLEGHSAYVNSVSFSPDGKTLASASTDRMVKLWSTEGEVLQTLEGHSAYVNSVSFSPDGKTLASASRDGTVKIWSAKGKLLQTLEVRSGSVTSVSFSPDSKTLASASTDRTVKLWSNEGKLLHTLEGHNDFVNSVSFSPDSKTLASASDARRVKLWSTEGKLLHTLEGHSGYVNSVSFSPDGRTLASASADGTVKLWSTEGKLLHTLEGHSGYVNSVSFSPDGRTLASASTDRTVKLWSTEGKLLHTLEGHSAYVTSVSFSPDGKTLASASEDRTVKLWNFNLVTLTQLSCDWVANFLILNPEILAEFEDCHTQARLEASSIVLVEKATTLAKRGLIEDAKGLLKMAKQWSPSVDLLSQTSAIDSQVNQAVDILSIPFKLKEGKRLAREGQEKKAITLFEKIQALKPDCDLDPATEEIDTEPQAIVDPLIVKFLVDSGRQAAKSGNVKSAIDFFQAAVQRDSEVDLNPDTEKEETDPKTVASNLAAKTQLETGLWLVREGKIEDAIAAYKKAQAHSLDIEITSTQWNSLCWFGSIYRKASQVLFACDNAVTLEPKSGGIKDSRGLARALTGNTQGAIEDFQAFIQWEDNEQYKAKRQKWIEVLQAGQDPFTDEELKPLLNE